MRQIFTYPLPNIEPHTVEAAKREVASCASELGFYYGAGSEWKIQKYHDQVDNAYKHRLEIELNAQNDTLFDALDHRWK